MRLVIEFVFYDPNTVVTNSNFARETGINVIVFFTGTKEMAFVHAIASAGVAHALTRACSAGELENCGCDRSLKGTSPAGFEVRPSFIFLEEHPFWTP